MNSAGVTVSDSPTPANLFDEFEEAFQNCLAPLTKEDPLNGINQEELKVNAETNGQRFLELAHRMEAAFLQKRFLLSVQKPELLLMEENHEMRIEIGRKDELIKKQTEKLTEWQNTLVNLINRVGSVPTYGPRTPTVGSSTTPAANHMSMIGSGGPTTNQTSMPGLNPATSISLVGGMSHGSNISHNMNQQSISMSHPSIMGQVGSGGSNMTGGMGQGGYQSIGSMNSSGNTMHGGSMGGGGPSPMGPMGGNQGQVTMGVGSANMTSNMGSNLGVGSGPSGQVSAGSGGGMYHSSGGAQSMGVMTQSQGGLQGPLAYLEKTTTNIGMPEPRR